MELSERIVISKRYTGLGDCLTSLLGAWRFASRTQRSLVADWRFSCYSTEATRNLFGTIFATPPRLAGVPFLGDDRVNDLRPSGSFYMPRIWNPSSIHTRPVKWERGDGAEIMALLKGGHDTPEEVVVFEQCLSGGYATESEARLFFGALEPVELIAGMIEDFTAESFDDRYVIGVHIRHGNGGNILGHTPYWRRPARALSRLTRSVLSCYQALRNRGEKEVVVFLSTDSAEVEEYGRAHWPGVVSRHKRFRDRGMGEMHHGPDSSQGLNDAVADMFLLAKSDVLIRYPESSFADLARYLKRPEPAGLVFQKVM